MIVEGYWKAGGEFQVKWMGGQSRKQLKVGGWASGVEWTFKQSPLSANGPDMTVIKVSNVETNKMTQARSVTLKQTR